LQRQKAITQRQAIFEEIKDQLRMLSEYSKNGPLIKHIKELRLAKEGMSELLKNSQEDVEAWRRKVGQLYSEKATDQERIKDLEEKLESQNEKVI
jgi:predicted DNA-binding protein YlxM (UPF0122 family)